MRFNKKAALQLSINAIVILILAITILGLGLGFIKSQFGALTKRFGEVSAEIKSEIINKIKESGELLVFTRVELEAKLGKPEEFYIGVKNTDSNPDGDSICFRMAVKCIRPLKEGSQDYCPPGDLRIVGGRDDTNEASSGESNWFTMFDEIDIKNFDVGVFPVKLQIANANPDTYLMEFYVYKATTNENCASGPDFSPYQSKQFFIKVS